MYNKDIKKNEMFHDAVYSISKFMELLSSVRRNISRPSVRSSSGSSGSVPEKMKKSKIKNLLFVWYFFVYFQSCAFVFLSLFGD
jgi:hypothetical protein